MKKLLFLLLTGLMIGCVSIRSNVKTGAVPQFKRVLVVTKMYRPPRNYEQQYLGLFPKEYEVCVVGLTPLSFNPDSLVREQERQCKSDAILTIELQRLGVSDVTQVGGVVQNNSTPSHYLAEMKSVTTGESFWKAMFSGGLDNAISPRTVVKQLVKDGVLNGKMPTPNERQVLR